MQPVAEFPDVYDAVRNGFRARSLAAQADGYQRLPLAAESLDGEPLSIDIAWFGSLDASCAIVHLAGLHGVEGFAGAAIQFALLSGLPTRHRDTVLILVSGLNPYGMDRVRRANEHNVDLNRNGVAEGGSYTGAPKGYRQLHKLLNPCSPPARDGFYARALFNVLRYGYASLKQAVAAGQYEYPQGLFYGGADLAPGLVLFRAWLASELNRTRRLVAVDVHTGLGPWGRDTLFAESPAAMRAGERLAGRPVVRGAVTAAGAYTVSGGLGAALPAWLPGVEVLSYTQEFGTYPTLRILHALREENRWHHFGAGSVDHATKTVIKEIFCPRDRGWRGAVVRQGVDLVHRVVGATGEGPALPPPVGRRRGSW